MSKVVTIVFQKHDSIETALDVAAQALKLKHENDLRSVDSNFVPQFYQLRARSGDVHCVEINEDETLIEIR